MMFVRGYDNKIVILSQNLIMQKETKIIPKDNIEKFNEQMEKIKKLT